MWSLFTQLLMKPSMKCGISTEWSTVVAAWLAELVLALIAVIPTVTPQTGTARPSQIK